jgi:hypothetical protein
MKLKTLLTTILAMLVLLVPLTASAQQPPVIETINGWVYSNTVTVPPNTWLVGTGQITGGDTLTVPALPGRNDGQFLEFGQIAMGNSGWMLAALLTYNTFSNETICTGWNAQHTAETGCSSGQTVGIAGHWAMQTWIANPSTYQLFAGPSVQVSPGDLLSFSMACSGSGACVFENDPQNWLVEVIDNSVTTTNCANNVCAQCAVGPNLGKGLHLFLFFDT